MVCSQTYDAFPTVQRWSPGHYKWVLFLRHTICRRSLTSVWHARTGCRSMMQDTRSHPAKVMLRSGSVVVSNR